MNAKCEDTTPGVEITVLIKGQNCLLSEMKR